MTTLKCARGKTLGNMQHVDKYAGAAQAALFRKNWRLRNPARMLTEQELRTIEQGTSARHNR